jgi:6-phosphogluconolactonase
MKLHTFQNFDEFVDESVKFISEEANSYQERKRIALSGGSAPKTIYETLAKADLQFQNIDFYQVDERYVPLDHQDSNCRMIFEALINKVDSNFHYFDTKLSIEEALEKYEKELPDTPFDLTILGIGPDGHVASLFPHTETLDEIKPIAHTTTEEFAVHDRLTLTFSKILESKRLLVLLHGFEKQKIVDELQNPSLSYKDFPARKLIEHPDFTIHFCSA